MKVAVVVGDIPNPTTGGGALTAWSVIHGLRRVGHQVTAFLIENLHASPGSTPRAARLAALDSLGVKAVSLDGALAGRGPTPSLRRWSRRLAGRLEEYYPTVRLDCRVRSALEQHSPQVIIAYHFEALAATYRVGVAPVMAGVGDPTHLPVYYRWRKERFRLTRDYAALTLGTAVAMWRLPQFMRLMMTSCDGAGAFAAHHAAWFRQTGVPHCQYLRTPVVDEAGPQWAELRQRFQGGRKWKILLVGHLKGIATLSGLYLFAQEVLPRLEQELGPDTFEVHIVGGYRPPEDLHRLLDRPSVRWRGQVEPATEEFLSSDVLVVPTPIELGIRVRILTGFSFGCCVVAHEANALGIPEMIHRKNALLAKDGQGLAEAILAALEDRALREKLGVEARRTYEEYFSLPVAAGRIISELERIAA